MSNELKNFMKQIHFQIQQEYERISFRAKEDPGTAGDQSEENWAKILRDWLPNYFHIVTKGRIIDSQGNTSPQIDIIVLKPEYPIFLLDKKLYLSEGVVACFECKLTLKSGHIRKFFDTSKKIKSLCSNDYSSPYRALNKSILYGLLSHSHSWKQENVENIMSKEIYSKDLEFVEHPSEMPDIICIANVGIWSASKTLFLPVIEISDEELSEEEIEAGVIDKLSFGEYRSYTTYLKMAREYKQLPGFNQYEDFTPIGSTIDFLLYKLAYQYPNLRSISKYFLDTNFGKGASLSNRQWEIHNIYPNELKEQIDSIKFSGEISEIYDSLWNEWKNSGI